MSLEAAIEELTKQVKIQTEAINKSNDLAERMISLKSEAIETVKTTAAKPTEDAPKSTKATKAEKPAAEPEKPAAEAEKPAEKELDEVGQAIADYVGKGYDESHPKAKEERIARGGKVKEIFAKIAEKKGIEVKKHSDIPDDMKNAFLKTLAKRVEEGNLVIGVADEDDLDA